VLPFVTTNFDALANEDGVITYGSLKKAARKFPDNVEQISFVQDHLSSFGHEIGYDHEAKAAALLSASTVSPMGTAVTAAADFAIYGISKDDLAGNPTISVSHWGTVTVKRG
jgi:hypothetical protein